MIGKVVNYRYEVLEKCGDGNFFSVYKARDKVLNRLVAVKVHIPQNGQNESFGDRLISEAQLVADLNHPCIAKVFEADSQDGVHFIATEYVRGINLKDRIRRTAPFSVAYAVDIASAIAQALDYAHRNGIIHGDVRPQNVMTSPEGQVKLTDFGSAKALSAFPNIREATMLRSVHYMAPEVIRGEPGGPESDIYSLGVTLFEMLTGTVPYDGNTSAAVAARQLQDPVRTPRDLNPGVPPLLNEIVVKMMQKDPAQRFSSAAEVIAALDRVKEWLRTGQAPAMPGKKTVEKAPSEDLVYEPEIERVESFRKTLVISLLSVFAVAIITAVLFVHFLGGTGANELTVPDLIGKAIEDAQQIADRTGISLQIQEEYNENIPEGQVYSSNPPPGGVVKKDNPVLRVWVSKGPRTLVIPDVVGMTANDARETIVDRGFVPGKSESEYSETVSAGRVISQTPRPGTRLKPSQAVDIVISLGPEPTSDDVAGPDSPDESEEDLSLQEREIPVTVTVPDVPKRTRTVKVELYDANGKSTPITQSLEPGGTLDTSVTAVGESIEIKVYVDDKLVQDNIY